jgi:signal peptidase I
VNSGSHAEQERPGIVRRFLSFVLMIAIVIGASWALRTYAIEPFKVPSGSMEDTIETGDMVFSEKLSYQFGSPKQGDIVTFYDPEIPSRVLIKRVIATGGQTVDLVDGAVFVDGVALSEPYVRIDPATGEAEVSEPLSTASGVSISYPYTVPEGHVWVMGDNRTNSADSRYFGPIEESSVFGHGVFTYWPLERIGVLE